MLAALYVVLTMLVKPIASGPIQFRISEALMVVPALLPAAVPGLYLGCVLSNVLTGMGWVDIVFGGLATLLACIITRLIAKKCGLLPEQQKGQVLSRTELLKRKSIWLLPLPSIIFNAAIVGVYLPLLFPEDFGSGLIAILISVGELALSEAVVVYVLGIPFFLALHPVLVRRPQWIK